MTALSKARERLKARRLAVAAAKKNLKAAQAKVAETLRTIRRLNRKQAPGPWMSGVTHDPVASIGASTVGEKAGLLHTTEGLDFVAMDGVLKAKRACPHFLVGRAGQIKQYRPIWDAATALENAPGGVETNRKRLPQIEVCAFAKDPAWPEVQRQAVAKVMAFCAANGVPLKCTVAFTDAAHVKRLSGPAWLAYSGWLGHQHAPENSHWDPGAIDITDLLTRARALVD